MTKDLIVLGAAVYDITARLKAETVNECDSNPSSIYSSCGGVGRNIVENAARLGLSAGLITVLGHDDFSKALRASCENVGTDLSRCFTQDDFKPCTYINIIEKNGELLMAASDLTSVEAIPPEFFISQMEYVNTHRLVCLDANLTSSQLAAIAENCTSKIMGDTVSIAKVPRFLPILERLYAIKTNIAELGALAQTRVSNRDEVVSAAKTLISQGVQLVFVTLGADGAICVGADFCEYAPAIKTPVTSVTGVGDAFSAGVAYGILRELPPVEILKFSTAMSFITLQSAGAVSEDVTEGMVLQVVESQN